MKPENRDDPGQELDGALDVHLLAVRRNIEALLADRVRVSRLVNIYYEKNRTPAFAGELFDGFGENPPDNFTADDIVAASLLDVQFGPEAVRTLLTDDIPAGPTRSVRQEISDLLTKIPSDKNIWDDIDIGPGSPSWDLWAIIRGIHRIGPTRVSKLLARKRPRLLPILDAVVVGYLQLPPNGQWELMRDALKDPGLRGAIDAMAPASTKNVPTTLRILDVAIWMLRSQSQAAHKARISAGYREERN